MQTVENALRALRLPDERPGWPSRTDWGPGPWDDEPDLVEWRHAGLPCLAVRGPSGAWCGYVGVPGSHPAFGRHYDRVDVESAHCGLTFSDTCHGHICHVPGDREPNHVWWLGFDCAHAGDLSPGLNVYTREVREQHPELFGIHERWETYRDLAYVRGCVEELAAELAKQRRRGFPALVEDCLAGVKGFFRRDLPALWREIYLEQDHWGRGPEERAQLRQSYGEERWDPNGLKNMARARRRDRPWRTKKDW